MLDLISKDLREYMEQNHLEFTDFEKAALIFNACLPELKKLELLERLAEGTGDAVLKAQILARIAYDRQDLEAFRNNAEGYAYAVELREDDGDPYICGYFASADMAFAHGMKHGHRFKIEKYCIVGLHGREAKKMKGYMNPYHPFGKSDPRECVDELDYDGSPEASAAYDKDGTLTDFWSSEIERADEEELKVLYDPALFTNAFIFIPNPFELGDIVRLTYDHDAHGIVALSQEEWSEFLERVNSNQMKGVDFSDASLTVDFLQENGHIMHSHICPAFLEKFEPAKEDEDYELLRAGGAVLKGQCSLDWFTYCYEDYKKRREKKAAAR